MNSPERSFWPR